MCGICILFSSGLCTTGHSLLQYDVSLLNRRGPDCQLLKDIELTSEMKLSLFGSVLHFRGVLTPQPLECNGNLLLWNGELFEGFKISDDENDGQFISNKLSQCHSSEDILHSISQIRGPWALIYWQGSRKKLWFGRDVFGRRSLLWTRKSSDSVIALSSVQIDGLGDWSEVPAAGLFCIQFEPRAGNINCENTTEIRLFPWIKSNPECLDRVVDLSAKPTYFSDAFVAELLQNHKGLVLGKFGVRCEIPTINEVVDVWIADSNCSTNCSLDTTENSKSDCVSLPTGNLDDASLINTLLKFRTDHHMKAAEKLLDLLSDAVRLRVSCQNVMCSICIGKLRNCGGFSCTNEPVLCSHTTELDVENVRTVIDDVASQSISLCKTPSNSVDSTADGTHSSCRESSSASHHEQMSQAVKTGGSSSPCGHARVAVLFSGGIDSLVLAALADRHVSPGEPIDLLNVAFEQTPNRRKRNSSCNSDYFDPYDVPDRITGRNGVDELRLLNPQRQWNFVLVNVPLDELQLLRHERIRHLIYPSNSVLDDSIGCAVWFAARGKGLLNGLQYTTTARVVLVGMGADEQLAGYSRHRVRFSHSGWRGLIDEISMELERLSHRNLGRDDRVIADHGREARLPYLDENVVQYLCSLPMHLKANLNLPRGVGEKLLLRLLAYRIGLRKGAVLAKRAIQFGSRIAKIENGRERASDVCDRLNFDPVLN